MLRAVIIACIVLVAWCLVGCVRPAAHRVGHTPGRPLSPDAHKELAAIAADVVDGLHQRVEADEPLTPDFVSLLCEWARRQYAHAAAAAADRSGRVAAAQQYWRHSERAYRNFHDTFDMDAPLQHAIAEYALREAELSLAAAKTRPPGDGVGANRSQRSLRDIASEIVKAMELRIQNDEPLTPDFVMEACDASRRLCLARMASASDETERVLAAGEYAEQVSNWWGFVGSQYTSGGPFPRHNLEFLLAEAKLWAAQAGALNLPEQAELYSAMAKAGRAHLNYLQERQAAEEPLTFEFVEEICVWSRRLWRAEEWLTEGRERHAAAQHRRRMRDLYTRLKTLFDEGGDVSRIQVSQAEYFLSEAERVTPLQTED